MAALTEGMHEGEFIGELAMSASYHINPATVLSGEELEAGAVVGGVPSGTSASAAKSGGNAADTGTFVLDVTTPLLPGVIEGVYKLRCTAAASNGGTFRLYDPDGLVLGDYTITGGSGGTVTVGKHIKGVLTDGSTDFSVGEGFDVTVSALAYKLTEYDPAGTDGSEVLRGILMENVDASGGDQPATLFFRGPARVNGKDLIWKTGLSDAQKSIALAAMERRGIRVV